jgi:hypothetical protein
VRVHLAQPRQQELSFRTDHVCALRNFDAVGGPDSADHTIGDQDGRIVEYLLARHRNDASADDRDDARRGWRLGGMDTAEHRQHGYDE